jgi:methyltransferase family protein
VATDLESIVRELTSFYDVADKKVVVIGAGGGQLVEFVRPARQVIAVDRDVAALERLAARLEERGLAAKFTRIPSDVLEVCEPGDVVYLEFCLHQMPDPGRALEHAATLAPDVLVIDHAPGSPWSWCAAEERPVEAAWQAVERRAIRRLHTVLGEQRFPDHAALAARLSAQGPLSLERIGVYRGRTPIAIPMPYRLALLGACPRGT